MVVAVAEHDRDRWHPGIVCGLAWMQARRVTSKILYRIEIEIRSNAALMILLWCAKEFELLIIQDFKCRTRTDFLALVNCICLTSRFEHVQTPISHLTIRATDRSSWRCAHSAKCALSFVLFELSQVIAFSLRLVCIRRPSRIRILRTIMFRFFISLSRQRRFPNFPWTLARE